MDLMVKIIGSIALTALVAGCCYLFYKLDQWHFDQNMRHFKEKIDKEKSE